MLKSVFCSRINCGCTCMSKRRAVSNSRNSTCANEISLSGLLKIGSQTVRICGFEFIDPRTARHPTRFHMQGRDAGVVTVEKRHEIFGQIMLVARLQSADDAEIHRRVARVLRIVDLHEDIAGVHVGVKKIVAEHLREKNLHAVFRELCVCSCRAREVPRHY